MVMTTVETLTFSAPILSLHTQTSPKFNNYRYLILNCTENRMPINCKSSARESFYPIKASSSFVAKNAEPMVPPYNVLITGSSKGSVKVANVGMSIDEGKDNNISRSELLGLVMVSILIEARQTSLEYPLSSYMAGLIVNTTTVVTGIGYALAKEFLKAGDNVIICSRSEERVKSAVESLQMESGKQHVWGIKCDVRKGDDVKILVTFAQDQLKYIDIWINNAGSNAYCYKPLIEASDEDLIEVVSTNTLGLMICCREAINIMQTQARGGHIFNIDGAGSDGRPTPRFAAYGATKCSVVHLTKSLQAELRMQDVKNVVVHNLSPGMVTTDLLMSGANTKQAKFFINVLAEPAEVVAQYLVPNIRSVPTNGSGKPTYIRFLTGLKAYSQIFSRFAFGARRNRHVLED